MTKFFRPNEHLNTKGVPPYLWVTKEECDDELFHKLDEKIRSYFPRARPTRNGLITYYAGHVEISMDTDEDHAYFILLASAGAFDL